jgi:hypothetical protein
MSKLAVTFEPALPAFAGRCSAIPSVLLDVRKCLNRELVHG